MNYDFAITIPKYIKEVELSKKQLPKYYEYNGITIKSKGKRLLQKYIAKEHKPQVKVTGIVEPYMLHSDYTLVVVNKNKTIIPFNQLSIIGKELGSHKKSSKILLFSKVNQQLVIANETKAGKPNVYKINGQDFYSGNINPFARRKVIQAIKESYLPYLSTFPIIDDWSAPYLVQLIIFDCPKLDTDKAKDDLTISQFWDVGNRAFPYAKSFLDLIATGKTGKLANRKTKEYVKYFEPLIPDDHLMYISKDPSGARFIPIDSSEDRKLVFVFTKDKNSAITNNKYYKHFYKTVHNEKH